MMTQGITVSLLYKEEEQQLKELLLDYFFEIDKSKVVLNEAKNTLNYPYLDSYWTDRDRNVYGLWLKNKLIGFALVNSYGKIDEFNASKSIAEFYISGAYRRQGLGRCFAKEVINKYQVKWEIRVQYENKRALLFWSNLLKKSVVCGYKSVELDEEVAFLFEIIDVVEKPNSN